MLDFSMIHRASRAAFGNAKGAGWKWLFLASVCGACGMLRAAKPEAMPDGSLRLSCSSTLNECLASIDDTVCRDGYDVIRAQEKRERRGPEPLPSHFISSEAVVRCRTPEALFSFSSKSDRDSGPLPASDSAAPEEVTAPQGSAAATTPAAATTVDAAPE